MGRAWLNYAWFASAYDTDDKWFRLLTMVQMFGALVLAVGVAQFATNNSSTVVAVFLTAYTITRWLMLDRFHSHNRNIWLAYSLSMGWLVGVVALYHFTQFDTIWLGWMIAVSPVVMTLVCAKDVELKSPYE